MSKTQVLFFCTNISSRSKMAERILNTFYKNKYEACSAGITPTKVNPYAIEVMKEIGIDIFKHILKSIYEFQEKNLITL